MKNIFPVSRMTHDAKIKDYDQLNETYASLCETFRAQSAHLESLTLQFNRQAENLAAIATERDKAQQIAVLALTMLNEVNAPRTGGQAFRDRRDGLNAFAKEQGLWEEKHEQESQE